MAINPTAKMLATAMLMVGALVTVVTSQQQAAQDNLFTAAGLVVRYADTLEKLAQLHWI